METDQSAQVPVSMALMKLHFTYFHELFSKVCLCVCLSVYICMCVCIYVCVYVCMYCMYHIRGIFGGGFNLAVWQITSMSPN